MSKATPIPDTIERRPGGIEKASCIPCGGKITRGINMWNGQSTLPWWHVATGRIVCMESRDGDD
jgi:hypothetical protein